MLALQRTKCRCPLRIFSDLPLILLLGTSDSLVLLLLSLDEGKNQVFSSNWIDGLFVNAFIVGCFDERLYESLRRELGVLEGSFVVLGLVVANIDGKFELNRDGVIFVYVFLFEKVDVDDGSFVVCCMIVVDIDGILESERYWSLEGCLDISSSLEKVY